MLPSASLSAPTGQCEDEFGICPCNMTYGAATLPEPTCFWCKGSGYRLTKRIIRPLPTPDFSEQAALAQLKTKDALLLRAAKTLDYNADILLAAGKRTEAGQTKQAAKAIREAVGEEG